MNTKSNHTIIGCTEAESNTFKVIFNHPDGITASSISKELGQPRGTIYGHLDVLINKGLVSKSLNESGTLFTPEPIESVYELYDRESAQIAKEKSNLAHMLKRDSRVSQKKPKFTVFEGKNVAERYFKEILRNSFSEMVGIWPAKYMAENVPEHIMKEFHENRIKSRKKIRILWPFNEVVNIKEYPQLGSSDSKQSLREVRILPKKINSETAFIVHGTKVTFLSPKSEYYGFTIDSVELSTTLHSQFEYLWSISKEHRNK